MYFKNVKLNGPLWNDSLCQCLETCPLTLWLDLWKLLDNQSPLAYQRVASNVMRAIIKAAPIINRYKIIHKWAPVSGSSRNSRAISIFSSIAKSRALLKSSITFGIYAIVWRLSAQMKQIPQRASGVPNLVCVRRHAAALLISKLIRRP